MFQKQLDFHTGHSSPVILITRATYGEIGTAADPRDMSRSIDVTNEVQSKVLSFPVVHFFWLLVSNVLNKNMNDNNFVSG